MSTENNPANSRVTPADFPRRRLFRRFEGGAVYVAEAGVRFYVITDESSMASVLDEDDLAGLELVRTIEFSSEDECSVYLTDRFGGADRP